MLKEKIRILLILIVATLMVLIWPVTVNHVFRYGSILLAIYLAVKFLKFSGKKVGEKKVIKIPMILMTIIFSLYALATEDRIFKWISIGNMINRFYPCRFDESQSFLSYCYQEYDIFASLLLAAIFAVSFLVAISAVLYFLIKLRKNAIKS